MGNHKEMTMTEIVSGAVDTLRQQAKFGAPITREYPGIADVLEELAARNDVLRADLAEARGVVERMPKTADGAAVFIGMTVWSNGSLFDSGPVICIEEHGYLVNREAISNRWYYSNGEGYSTREAAQAAASGGGA